ncbi:MAG: hypothetical protein H6Q28_861, partial [Bacteroidetes bacterium]|nr:hypothetical protein [Bacteroidota bacterium]
MSRNTRVWIAAAALAALVPALHVRL